MSKEQQTPKKRDAKEEKKLVEPKIAQIKSKRQNPKTKKDEEPAKT